METPIGVDTAMEIEASFFRSILCVVIVEGRSACGIFRVQRHDLSSMLYFVHGPETSILRLRGWRVS